MPISMTVAKQLAASRTGETGHAVHARHPGNLLPQGRPRQSRHLDRAAEDLKDPLERAAEIKKKTGAYGLLSSRLAFLGEAGAFDEGFPAPDRRPQDAAARRCGRQARPQRRGASRMPSTSISN